MAMREKYERCLCEHDPPPSGENDYYSQRTNDSDDYLAVDTIKNHFVIQKLTTEICYWIINVQEATSFITIL